MLAITAAYNALESAAEYKLNGKAGKESIPASMLAGIGSAAAFSIASKLKIINLS